MGINKTLYICDIKVDYKIGEFDNYNNLFFDIYETLTNKKKKVIDRLLELNSSNEDIEKETINYFELSKDGKYLFGSVINIGVGSTRNILTKELDKEMFSIKDISKQNIKDIAGFEKNLYYFCLDQNNKIVFTNNGNNRSLKSFTNYINNLLDVTNEYTIDPRITKVDEILDNTLLKEFKDITFSSKTITKHNESINKVINGNKLLLSDLMVVDGIDKEELGELIDIKIVLKFKKNKKDILNKNIKFLDLDNVRLNLKNKKQIDANTLLEQKSVTIQSLKTNKNLLNEVDLMNEMINYLKES